MAISSLQLLGGRPGAAVVPVIDRNSTYGHIMHECATKM
jgi:hypothetical protein